ncbi:MAG: MarR family winged helix-turn-helix transcriptional regulator [Candidatus Kapabacteria bacterium]|jgi:DNA-binding MarR family transcriptional regulator|nr:MarR family winged helix-turn-helix transcriptional regulator [Candidatus Kapabacteria bacterium]
MIPAQPSLTVFNPHYNSLNTSSKIVIAFERISEAFRVMLWQVSKSTGLSPLQIQILTFLAFHNPEQRTVSYLAEEFNMTKPTISDAIKSLEEKSIVKKEPSLVDSRSYTINLTEKGNLLAQQTSIFANQFTSALGSMPPIEQEFLLEHLLMIIQNFHKKGILTIQRTCFSCSFFKRYPMRSAESQNSYCSLLDIQLQASDVRLDCPHHEAMAQQQTTSFAAESFTAV